MRYATQKELAAALGITEGAMSKRIRRIVVTGRITEEGVKDALGRARKLRDADSSGEIVSFDPDEDPEEPDY